MTKFEQRNQKIDGNQYNAGRNMCIHHTGTRASSQGEARSSVTPKHAQSMAPRKTYSVFLSYAREDEPLLNRFKTHLAPLQRAQILTIWYARNISAGTDRQQEMHAHLIDAEWAVAREGHCRDA
jgi:hypothetical protein